MKSNKKLIFLLSIAVIFMFAFSYLMVPIFSWVCQKAGINGKGALSATAIDNNMKIDTTRTIRIDFAAAKTGSFNFDFRPEQRSVTVHPGERKVIYYYAENKTGNPITVQAVPSITPADGARFFKKIECFCFTQQHFKKSGYRDMFVNFYIDPAVPKEVKEITLSYTLFDKGSGAEYTL